MTGASRAMTSFHPADAAGLVAMLVGINERVTGRVPSFGLTRVSRSGCLDGHQRIDHDPALFAANERNIGSVESANRIDLVRSSE
jgi:hypothetical protein